MLTRYLSVRVLLWRYERFYVESALFPVVIPLLRIS